MMFGFILIRLVIRSVSGFGPRGVP
jgi:hypothetical protein